jgi:hypothetical protein
LLTSFTDGHYLNLPVMNEQGEIVGMVDVLKLTYATLEQINTMSSGDGEGPAWNKFWLSLDNETESMVSGEGSNHHTMASRSMMSPDITRDNRLNESVAPGDSASHVGVDSPAHSVMTGSPEQTPAEIPFAFKFKTPSGRVHRLQVIASQGIAAFVINVASKLGSEAEAIGGAPVVEDGRVGISGFALSYLDDEGDTVSITTDQDLLEAILLARQGHREKVDLFVHDPSQPPITVTAPQPAPELPTPPPSSAVSDVRRRRAALSDEDEDESEEEDYATIRKRKTRNVGAQAEKEVIAGVPNELLLPGAIVTLAVVIVGVFAISRLGNR